jgi:L-proline amide hydrolase
MAAAAELRTQLPLDTQAALTRHEEAGTVTDPEYLAATDEFYRRHVCRVVPTPQDFVDTITQMEAEPTVYHTMNGPNEFPSRAPPREWSIIDRLHRITAPTLVIAGEFDEATPATWQPYVRAHPRRRKPRIPRHQSLHASGETPGVPRRRRRVLTSHDALARI